MLSLMLSLAIGASPLAAGAFAGWALSDAAGRLIDRRILPLAALAIAVTTFALAPYAPRRPLGAFDIESTLFLGACIALMFGVGGGGWVVTKKWGTAALVAVGPSIFLVIASPLWRLALACGLLGSCP